MAWDGQEEFWEIKDCISVSEESWRIGNDKQVYLFIW